MNAMIQTAQHGGNQHNPFHSNAVAVRPTSNAIADASQQREIAEVQAAMVIAKRFPRNSIEATDRILQACTRPTLAQGALYSYTRGGSEVTGPSIRLAEAIAQAWGNVDFGIRELEQRDGASTVEAYAWDMETNTRQRKVFQVSHIRHTRNGSKKLEDPRDIYEMVANQGARRLRACILGVIPGDVIEAAVEQSEETLRASADTSPEAIKKLADAFAGIGVSQAQIEKRIQCRLEAIRPAQVVHLRKVYASVRDGMSGVGDWFDAIEAEAVEEGETPKRGNAGLKAKLQRKQEAAPTETSETLAATETSEQETSAASTDESPVTWPDQDA